MYKLVFCVEDEVVDEKEISPEELEEAFCTACNFDSDVLQEYHNPNDSHFAGVLDPDYGWLIWFNTEGESGTDWDKNDEISKLIDEYL